MKKVLMGLVAGMILATGAQALAYVCDGDTWQRILRRPQ